MSEQKHLVPVKEDATQNAVALSPRERIARDWRSYLSSPKSLARVCRRCTTPTECFTRVPVNFQSMRKMGGDGELEAYIEAHLTALSDFMLRPQGFTQAHIEYISSKIVNDEEFNWLNMADFNLIIDRIKSQYHEYGIVYNTFSADIFMGILRKYNEEKLAAIEEYHANENNRRKQEFRNGKAKLIYYIDGDGKLRFTEEYLKMQREKQEQKEEIERENKRKRDAAACFSSNIESPRTSKNAADE